LGEVLVSIILPCYNSEEFISETIESVLAQSYSNFELIIIDDCSTDKTAEIVDRFLSEDYRIKCVKLEANSGGPAKPRNVGLSIANGQYIAFVDSDDLWHIDKLGLQVDYMVKHSIDFTSTASARFSSPCGKLDGFNKETIDLGKAEKISFKSLVKKNRIVNSSVVLSAKVINGMSFNEEKKFVAIEDYLMWLSLHRRNNAFFSYKFTPPLVLYRVRKESISGSKLRMLFKNFLMYNRILEDGYFKKVRALLFTLRYVIFSVVFKKSLLQERN
jgi:teichuronic acid biosynthesis glycosyltransferase TuaG